MPEYIPAPEILSYPDIPHGTIQDTLFHSNSLGNTRRVRIYLPPGYDAGDQQYGTALFHDGLEYISLANANNVLDYLIYHRRIEPVIAVFVPPVNREPEYVGDQQAAFTTFIITELLPFVDSEYRTLTDPAHRATLGASNGGNIALWLGYSHPEVFGRIAAQSSNVQTSISSGLHDGPVLDLQFYLDIGTYDIPELPPLVHNLKDILDQRGYIYRYREYPEGHSWGNWRAHIDNALEMFFPGDSATTVGPGHHEMPGELNLSVFPNPFNSAATLTLSISVGGPVRITIFDIAGRRVRTLADSVFSAGTHKLTVSASGLASGVYFVEVQSVGGTVARKILLLK
jgi:enterochelin esterase family protein